MSLNPRFFSFSSFFLSINYNSISLSGAKVLQQQQLFTIGDSRWLIRLVVERRAASENRVNIEHIARSRFSFSLSYPLLPPLSLRYRVAGKKSTLLPW